jgi:hypothetical protein
MAFAGCSFTWGQGLWYYSALDSLIEDIDYGYEPGIRNAVHHKFRQKWRWPNKVADHFGTVDVTHFQNGGANDQIVEYWSTCFKNDRPVQVRSFDGRRKTDTTEPINYSDVSHFVFQFTQWWRSSITITVNGKEELVDVQTCWDNNRPYKKIFNDWFDNNKDGLGLKDLAEFHQAIIKRDIFQVKQLLQELEQQGIKTYVMSWPWEHTDLIKNDPWLNERFISFDYNKKNYRCIEELITTEKLTIETDTEFFTVPPKDAHPSLKAQQIIADNVIKFIENNNG